jgi:hypothetical protein
MKPLNCTPLWLEEKHGLHVSTAAIIINNIKLLAGLLTRQAHASLCLCKRNFLQMEVLHCNKNS